MACEGLEARTGGSGGRGSDVQVAESANPVTICQDTESDRVPPVHQTEDRTRHWDCSHPLEGVSDVCRAGDPNAAMLKPEREVLCGMRGSNLDALSDPVMYRNSKARQLEDNISTKALSGEHNDQWSCSRMGCSRDMRCCPALMNRGDCSIERTSSCPDDRCQGVFVNEFCPPHPVGRCYRFFLSWIAVSGGL